MTYSLTPFNYYGSASNQILHDLNQANQNFQSIALAFVNGTPDSGTVLNSVTSAYSLSSGTAQYSFSSGTSNYALYSGTSSFAWVCNSSSYANNSGTATFVWTCQSATYSIYSQTATFSYVSNSSNYSGNATFSSTAHYSLSSSSADYSTSALQSTNSLTSNYSLTSGYLVSSLFTSSSSYVVCQASNNVIIQSGVVSATQGVSGTVSFPKAFNTVISVLITPSATSSTSFSDFPYTYNVSNTAFSYGWNGSLLSGSACLVSWLAIGV